MSAVSCPVCHRVQREPRDLICDACRAAMESQGFDDPGDSAAFAAGAVEAWKFAHAEIESAAGQGVIVIAANLLEQP